MSTPSRPRFVVVARRLLAGLVALFALLLPAPAGRGEAMLQYFNTSWKEIADKMPELAEAGYNSLWIPPPTKGSGGLSVGYDLWDRFDLGSKDQRGSISTKYGTEADLLRLIETAHRFGIRVYLDNIMNHNAFDVPGYNENTPLDVYPGFVPEDFHLRLTPDGYYRKWDNIRDYNSEWQVQHLGLADLIDIAQEPGTTNENFGSYEGATFPKIKFLRNPDHPEYYCFKPDGTYVGFGPSNGITAAMLQQNAAFYSEYVNDYLNRAGRWLIDRTKADGLRLDAVKHVRGDFFGATFGADKDYNDYGYLGQVQRQFNLTRGFNDSRFNSSSQGFNVNLRESVFDTEKPRHNAMMFGEHLGEPPAYSDYFNSGMRLVDNVLRNNLNNLLGNPSSGLNGLDGPGSQGFAPELAVTHAQSHDNDYASRRELQHALYFTRAGLGLIYTDGNHQAQTLGESGGAFPRHANTAFLGQFGDNKVPNLLYIHNQFARGTQVGRYSDADFVAYERMDKRENNGMSDADGVTMLFLLNDNYAAGAGRTFNTSYPHAAGGSDSYLYNYSTYGGGFYKWASDITNGSTLVPSGGYFAFSYRTPELPDVNPGAPAIEIRQNGGQPVSSVTYLRKDGPDGDANFNPYNVPGAVAGSYAYPFTVPRVTNGANLSFLARADGSAENVLLALDGGVDVNSHLPLGPTGSEKRDYPPGVSTDTFLGYEQMQFVQRAADKFAAQIVSRNVIGSVGAETYQATIGASGFAVNLGSGYNTSTGTASYLYHAPENTFSVGGSATLQFSPAPQSAANQPVTVRVKIGYQNQINRAFLYYTTDGATFPEGYGGTPGNAATRVVEMFFEQHDVPDGSSVTDLWKGTLPALTAGTTVRYKIGGFLTTAPSVFPSGPDAVALKKKMETRFQVTGFNATTAKVYPHNDYGQSQTGLTEGFHVLRARQFLSRAGRASLYNTAIQTFYYDAQPPAGVIAFPANDGDTIGGSGYGAVVRTDPSVTEVWYKLIDGDASNDDASIGVGTKNGNGAWVQASSLTPNPAINNPALPSEWRFNYVNIPSSGTAQIVVRLRELSSAEMTPTAVNDASADVASHWTTLVRTVNTAGPSTRMFVAFPQGDGEVVDNNYVMKVWFSKSLADNTNTAQLLNRFLIKLASSESGSPANGVAQDRANYAIHYNVTNDYHELAFTLPNLYNGNPDFLHTIDVTYTLAGSPTLQAFRLVKARPVATIKNNIVNPPEFDGDGKTYETTLPDVANPTVAQRTVAVRVETDLNATSVALSFPIRPAGDVSTVALKTVTPPDVNPSTVGATKFWDFTWTGVTAGTYQILSTVTTSTPATSTATRGVRVVFRQLVDPVVNKLDNDDDGLADALEKTRVPLPTANSETWVNGDVHLYNITGRTQPLQPDTDGDGMSDGLELGWAGAVGDTNAATDTNGDGVPNFQPDLDPPLYNTVPDNNSRPAGYEYFDPWPYNLNNSRTDQLAGSLTDPNKPDTDDDRVNDGLEDRTFAPFNATFRPVHNGRVDILPNGAEGETVIAHPPTVYSNSRVDRAKVLARSPNAVWLETDPNNQDTDADGLSEGAEDANGNGIVDLAIINRNQLDAQGNYVVLGTFTNPLTPVVAQPSAQGAPAVTFNYLDFCSQYREPTNNALLTSTALDRVKLDAIFKPQANGGFRADGLDVIWLETDPRRRSTSGDGLPDGWKVQHGLDPWDDGNPAHVNLHTGKPGNPANGPGGDPDGDGFTNQQEFLNNTDPQTPETAVPPPAGSITIGPVPDAQAPTFGAVKNTREFTDWTAADLIALGPYDGDGPNQNGSDVYHANDGFDSSRDLVAFYAHDGGDAGPAQGGDGNFYFRVDLHDLKAYAEEGKLDVYVAVNVGNPGTGEYNLPDEIDTGTLMRWQAVVACYQTNVGQVYVDRNPANNTTAIGGNLTAAGVVNRDPDTGANYFKKSYYNADLDAVEFSISRKALRDAGWNGLNAADLLYQVYVTKDGTLDSPVGAGNIGGRSDIRDALYNDYLASDYYQDQANISGQNSILRNWMGVHSGNDRGKRVKVLPVIYGSEPILPGSQTQTLINNDAGAGFYRPLDVHQAYNVPFSLHATPTLASAIQWASANPAANKAYLDGPAFNARLAGMMNAGTVDLLGTTFADHVPAYFPKSFNRDNVSLARDHLLKIYGVAPSANVLWLPEQVADADTLDKVADLGFNWTFVDQMRHVFKWFGRNSAVGSDGYRVNRINGVNCLVINDGNDNVLFTNDDNGAPLLLRQLLSRKARDNNQQDQVIVLPMRWEDFADKTKADAYDKNIRWLASHPWVQLVTADQIANNQVDLSRPPDGNGDAFGTVNRGTGLSLPKVQRDFIDHATQENYDNWYYGSSLEESLSAKKFTLRNAGPVILSTAFGQVGASGLADAAWTSVAGLNANAQNAGLLGLARATSHAAMFETAFHNQSNNDLSKFSTGAYINPDGTVQTLAGFAKFAQAQARTAAVYARVNAWAAAARAGTYASASVAEQADVDLDGENEFLLFNDRLFAVFERQGGRMTGAWLRDVDSGAVFQVAGNPPGYAGAESEDEGASNATAYRASGFKDWFAQTGGVGVGTSTYVNDLYAVAPATGSVVGWQFTSSNNKVAKTITLSPRRNALTASYTLAANGGINLLYTRFGLSPDLADLLTAGQTHLGPLIGSTQEVDLFNRANAATAVRAYLRFGGGTFAGSAVNGTAADSDAGTTTTTVPMRNLAQTHQVELASNPNAAGTTWTFALGFETGAALTYDTDGDGLPDWFEQRYGLDPTSGAGVNGPAGNLDGDNLTNYDEYLFGTNPALPDGALLRESRDAQGRSVLTFNSLQDRLYRVLFTNDLQQPFQPVTGAELSGTGGVMTFTDDGNLTGGLPPGPTPRRFYRLQVRLP